MSKRLVFTLIIILVVLNLGFVGFVYYKLKASASELATSADSTANSSSVANLVKLNLGKSEIPSSDVGGQDLGGLTRYRADVRSAYTQNSNGTATAEYKTTTAANIVLSYYRKQLAKNGWILQSANDSEIVFSQASQIIKISASTNSNGITTYTVTL